MRISTLSTKTTRAERFSLIEWLVVLAVIGMVLGVVLPRIGLVPSSVRIAKSTGAIRAAFKTALGRSMASGQIVQVYFDFPGHRLRLEVVAPPPPLEELEKEDGEAARQEREQAAFSLFDDLQLFELDELTDLNTDLVEVPENAAVLSYRFYPNGEAAGPHMPIRIDDRWFTVDVDRLTGRPIIVETEADP